MLEKKTYKNYKELCEALNWKVVTSDSKKKQFKHLETLCKYHKEGQKIIIDKLSKDIDYTDISVYEPKDNRTSNKKPTDYKNFNISRENWYSSGIYRIILDNKVYIGSTKHFRYRFIQHLSKDEVNIPLVYEILLDENCRFEVEEIVEDLNSLTTKEQIAIDKYISLGYDVLNRKRAKKEVYIKVHLEDYDKIVELIKNNGFEVC